MSYFGKLDTNNKNKIKICGNDNIPQCTFNYNFITVNTSLKVCREKLNNASNTFNMPSLKFSSDIWNQTTSTSESVMFNSIKFFLKTVSISSLNSTPVIFTNTNFNPLMENSSFIKIYLEDINQNNELEIFIPIYLKTTHINSTRDNSFLNILNSLKDINISECNTQTNVTSFDINKLIPDSSYYYFTKENSAININVSRKKYFLLFSNSGAININSKDKDLFNLINPASTSTSISKGSTSDLLNLSNFIVFYSTQRPVNSLSRESNADDIYISCQPTNKEGELLYSLYDKKDDEAPNLQNFLAEDAKNLLDSNWFITSMIGVIIMLILIFGSEFIFKLGSKSANR